MTKYKEYIEEIEIPSWDDFYLGMAKYSTLRSKDAQTKCGCVITQGKDLVTIGLNSFPRDMIDNELPNLRPAKYDFMIHAEENAIFNCARLGKSTLGATFYVTHRPCFKCLRALITVGANRVVYHKGTKAICHDEHDTETYKFLLEKCKRKIQIDAVTPEYDLDLSVYNKTTG